MSDDDNDYLFDKSGPVDPEVGELEKVLGAARYVSPAENRSDRVLPAERAPRVRAARPRRIFPLLAPLALAAAVFLALFLRKWMDEPAGPSLRVTRLEGTAHVGARTVGARGGRLTVGGWLETDAASRAEIELAQIGHVTVGPESRIRLAVVAPNEQRLELERGFIEAKVVAMPRLFVVDTPGARATDLGCAYRLEVVPAGGTMLRVTSGAVELAGEGRKAHVPAGAACETRPQRGPGCPYFEDASDTFKTALRSVDFDEPPAAASFDTLLAAARVRDTLTLWQLVWRLGADPPMRSRVIARVMELSPPPADVDLSGGAPGELEKYQDHLMTTW